jgi:hypothetical protein
MQQKRSLFLPISFFIRVGLVIFGATLFIRPLYYYLTEGFSLKRVEVTIERDPALVLAQPSKQDIESLSLITKQPFRYFKKGSQAYAFMSDDGKYILKLFKFHHMHSMKWLQAIPLPACFQEERNSLINHREERISLTLHSYKIAQEKLNKECALIFTQILPSSSYTLPVTIIDPVGRTYSFDLAHYGFALQHRVNLVLPALRNWIQLNKIDEAKKALSSLVGLFVTRCKKGIQDIDPDLHKNAGYFGSTAVHIDIGSFLENNLMTSKEKMVPDIQKAFKKLHLWLEGRSPDLASFLAEKLKDPEKEVWTEPQLSPK